MITYTGDVELDGKEYTVTTSFYNGEPEEYSADDEDGNEVESDGLMEDLLSALMVQLRREERE